MSRGLIGEDQDSRLVRLQLKRYLLRVSEPARLSGERVPLFNMTPLYAKAPVHMLWLIAGVRNEVQVGISQLAMNKSDSWDLRGESKIRLHGCIQCATKRIHIFQRVSVWKP